MFSTENCLVYNYYHTHPFGNEGKNKNESGGNKMRSINLHGDCFHNTLAKLQSGFELWHIRWIESADVLCPLGRFRLSLNVLEFATPTSISGDAAVGSMNRFVFFWLAVIPTGNFPIKIYNYYDFVRSSCGAKAEVHRKMVLKLNEWRWTAVGESIITNDEYEHVESKCKQLSLLTRAQHTRHVSRADQFSKQTEHTNFLVAYFQIN